MERREREINVLELFWKIIFSWRKIFLFSIIIAMILVGYLYIKSVKLYESQRQESIVEDIVLSKEEEEVIQQAVEIRKKISRTEKYLDESILMRIDPYEVKSVVLQFHIDQEHKNNEINYADIDVIKQQCYGLVKSKDFLAKVQEEIGIEGEWSILGELVTIREYTESLCFDIYVVCEDAEMQEALMSTMPVMFMGDVNERIQEGYSLQITGMYLKEAVDTSLISTQKTQQAYYEQYKTSLENLKNSMSEQQLEAFNALVGEQDETIQSDCDDSEDVSLQKPTIELRNVIIGGGIGCFLSVVYISLKYIFNNKIQEAKDVEILYDIRLLGKISSGHRAKVFPCIDNLLYKAKNKKSLLNDIEQQVDLICFKTTQIARKKGEDAVCLVCDSLNETTTDVLQKVVDKLKTENIEAKLMCKKISSIREFKELEELSNVILVMNTNQSKYNEIYSEVECIKNLEIDIWGSVVFTD